MEPLGQLKFDAALLDNNWIGLAWLRYRKQTMTITTTMAMTITMTACNLVCFVFCIVMLKSQF